MVHTRFCGETFHTINSFRSRTVRAGPKVPGSGDPGCHLSGTRPAARRHRPSEKSSHYGPFGKKSNFSHLAAIVHVPGADARLLSRLRRKRALGPPSRCPSTVAAPARQAEAEAEMAHEPGG